MRMEGSSCELTIDDVSFSSIVSIAGITLARFGEPREKKFVTSLKIYNRRVVLVPILNSIDRIGASIV